MSENGGGFRSSDTEYNEFVPVNAEMVQTRRIVAVELRTPQGDKIQLGAINIHPTPSDLIETASSHSNSCRTPSLH